MRVMFILFVLLLCFLSGGCSARARERYILNQDFFSPVSPNLLILPEDSWRLNDVERADAREKTNGEDADVMLVNWEFSRNDERLGLAARGQAESVQFAEVWQLEFLRTINGRPNESTTIITRSIKRAVVP